MEVPAGGVVTLSVDGDICMSSGRCVANAPQNFGFDDDHVAQVKADGPQLSFDDAADLAAGCPAGAILVAVDGVQVDV